MKRKFGWRKDREDSRDYSGKTLLKGIAPKKKIPKKMPKEYIVDKSTIIYNQYNEPACVGFSSVGVKTDEEFLQYKKRIRFDGSWLYAECKKIDGYPNDDGTEHRFAMKILSLGCKKYWCCSPDKKWKISAYYRIEPDTNDEQIKQIIYQYGSLVMGSTWYGNWMSVSDTLPEPDEDDVVGGHAYRIVGWNKKGFVVANSWGKIFWGEKGMATMPYSIFRKMLQEGDCWKLVDASL